MNDISKDRLYRFLQSLGIRLLKSEQYKFPYDRKNFIECKDKNLVIFDVGANIGQTSISYSINFPEAEIYSFEPFPIIYNSLKKNTRNYPSIKCYPFALGNESKRIQLPRINNPLLQTANVREKKINDGQQVDIITIKTLDEFCVENSIDKINILKTDTEGFDLEVLSGANKLLSNGCIENIVSEASIISTDKSHTNFFKLDEFLSQYGFKVFSFYEVHHNPRNGQLNYFNALYKRQ